MVIFHSYVKLPEGKHDVPWVKDWISDGIENGISSHDIYIIIYP